MSPETTAPPERLRSSFIGWQCRIRQHVMRQGQGRPSPGMVPTVVVNGESLARIVVLLNQRKLENLVKEFRFMYQRTQDPAARRDNAVRVMAASFFQQPAEFSDTLTALFSSRLELVERMLKTQAVVFHFEQHKQRCELPCRVRKLDRDQNLFQFAYWHNSLFNPNLPQDLSVLAFDPDWSSSGLSFSDFDVR